MHSALPRASQSRGANDRAQIRDCRSKLLINNNIVEFAAMLDLFACSGEPAFDRRRIVLSPPNEALAQRIERGRKDEDVN